MNFKFNKWSRPNPASIKKVEYALFKKIFDGDHALLNRYAVRKRYTIEQAIEKATEYEDFFKKEKELKENIEVFKEKASKGKVSINLKNVSDNLFYESDAMNEFWRVLFILHSQQESEMYRIFNEKEFHFLLDKEQDFISSLEDRETLVWLSYKKHNQDLELVSQELGISVSYVSRFLKKIFYTAKKGE